MQQGTSKQYSERVANFLLLHSDCTLSMLMTSKASKHSSSGTLTLSTSQEILEMIKIKSLTVSCRALDIIILYKVTVPFLADATFKVVVYINSPEKEKRLTKPLMIPMAGAIGITNGFISLFPFSGLFK